MGWGNTFRVIKVRGWITREHFDGVDPYRLTLFFGSLPYERVSAPAPERGKMGIFWFLDSTTEPVPVPAPSAIINQPIEK